MLHLHLRAGLVNVLALFVFLNCGLMLGRHFIDRGYVHKAAALTHPTRTIYYMQKRQDWRGNALGRCSQATCRANSPRNAPLYTIPTDTKEKGWAAHRSATQNPTPLPVRTPTNPKSPQLKNQKLHHASFGLLLLFPPSEDDDAVAAVSAAVAAAVVGGGGGGARFRPPAPGPGPRPRGRSWGYLLA